MLHRCLVFTTDHCSISSCAKGENMHTHLMQFLAPHTLILLLPPALSPLPKSQTAFHITFQQVTTTSLCPRSTCSALPTPTVSPHVQRPDPSVSRKNHQTSFPGPGDPPTRNPSNTVDSKRSTATAIYATATSSSSSGSTKQEKLSSQQAKRVRNQRRPSSGWQGP